MFTRRHEQELAEIKSLNHELGHRVKESLEHLTDIEKAQDEALRRASRPPRAERRLAAQEARRASSAGGNDVYPLVAFVHIPKTAGGTVRSMFAAAYSTLGLHAAGNYLTSQERTAAKLAKRPGGWERWYRKGGRVTMGHVPYGVFRAHLPPDTRYVTLIREPVDRVLSHYYFARHIHRRGMLLPATPGDEADSLDEALLEKRLPEFNNLATRFLCGHPSPLGDLAASALDDAKANLSEFAFVGIQERFEESLVLLQRTLGLAVPRDAYEDQHVSDDRPAVDEISDHQRQLIAEYNQLDTELYTFALGLFDDAVADADEGFAAAVDALRTSRPAARPPSEREAGVEADRQAVARPPAQ